MSPEAQRIAIVAVCGWQHCEINHHSTGMFRKGAAIGTSPNSERTLHVPSYTTDLNAMHEAEDNLLGMNKAEFAVKLCRIVGRDWPNGIGGGSFAHIHATAAQRAEAFLRTLGKWEDDK